MVKRRKNWHSLLAISEKMVTFLVRTPFQITKTESESQKKLYCLRLLGISWSQLKNLYIKTFLALKN